MKSHNNTTSSPAETRSLVRRVIKTLRFGDEGGSLVEFAVTFPIMMMVFAGIFMFSIAMNNYAELTEAVNTGSRLLAISRGNTLDPCSIVSNAVHAAAPTLATAKLSYTLTLNGTGYTGTSCSSSSTTTGAAGNLTQGSSATVKVTYPCNLSIWGKAYVSTCNLSSQTTELVQ